MSTAVRDRYICTNPGCTKPTSLDASPRVLHPRVTSRWVVCSPGCGRELQAQWEQEEQDRPPPPPRTVLEPEPGTEGRCGCGCGGQPKGGVFLPGHDAKLKARRKRNAT